MLGGRDEPGQTRARTQILHPQPGDHDSVPPLSQHRPIAQHGCLAAPGHSVAELPRLWKHRGA
jgi:hypothetical protein